DRTDPDRRGYREGVRRHRGGGRQGNGRDATRMSAIIVDAAPSPAFLPEGSALRRTIRSPETEPPADFLAAFDSTALVYDCFRDGAGRLLLVAPAPLNLLPHWRQAVFHAGGSALRPRFHISLSQMIVELVGAAVEAPALTMIFDGQPHDLPIRAVGAEPFAGRRVVFTTNKNNDR